MKTNIPPASFSNNLIHHIVNNLYTKIVVLFFLITSFVSGHEQEWIMQIVYGGAGPVSATVKLYRSSNLIVQGSCSGGLPWSFNNGQECCQGNFGTDVNAVFGEQDSHSDKSTFSSNIDPGSYLVRIISVTQDKYFTINIPGFNSPGVDTFYTETVSFNADFNLRVDLFSNTLSFVDNGRGASVGSSGLQNWIIHNVTLKNSFNADGIMTVDNNNVSIPAGGKTYAWDSPWFPHRLEAIDQKPITLNFWQRFQNWSTGSTNRSISISAGSGTYTANFQDEYNITFQNSFSGATGGVIKVDGTQHNAPYQTTALQYIGIEATAITNPINGISYTFSHWNDGSTQATNYHFSPTDHSTYTAYYTGKPNNSNRNLHFNASVPHQPITVIWSEHPNINVTKYQIWRRTKYKKGTTSQQVLIGTVNRGTTTFIDYEYRGTNLGFTDWILWYDVKSYFSLDATYSDDDFVLVFSDGPLEKKSEDQNDNTLTVLENKIENYPNPFNPSTVITFQIVNQGHVTLKIYDNLGREIETLVNEEKNTGSFKVRFEGSNLSSGIYFYRIIANGYTETKKMILTK
jgi:hypothetical protein